MLQFQLGKTLPWLPRFSLADRAVLVGPYTSAASYDHHFSVTTGSGDTLYDKSESIRFDPASRLLVSARVHAPEKPESIPPLLLRLFAKDAPEGLPLLPSEEAILVASPTVLFVDPQGKFIATARHELRSSLRCVRIAQDFELLVEGCHIEGWVLRYPSRYLSYGWDEGHPDFDGWQDLELLLAQFLGLIDDAFVVQLEDGELTALQKLHHLLQSTKSTRDCPQRLALVRTLESIVDTFY